MQVIKQLLRALPLVASAALLLPTACDTEEKLTKTIEYSDDFAIVDQPGDTVAHERYLIYKELGVPVYFNDTIAVRDKGLDRNGNPVVNYETIDLNWKYTGYERGVRYSYAYLRDPAAQMRALRYVRRYLATVSPQMRPFSIMVADTLTVSSRSKTEKPVFHVGFRTLVFSQVADLTDSTAIASQIKQVIKSMVSDRVKANAEVCARFAAYANDKGWYYNTWDDLGNCPTIGKWRKVSWMLTVNGLFKEPPYVVYDKMDFVDLLMARVVGNSAPYPNTREEAEADRQRMVAEMGNYGFICGWAQLGSYTPADDSEDREQYLQAMMALGDQGFRRRYGNAQMVMEKYRILYDYLTEKLGIDLNFDGTLAE